MLDVCSLLPSLEQAVNEVEELAAAGALAGHPSFYHVVDVTIPMLCSYMSRWWPLGPEGVAGCQMFTSVTPGHVSDLLGHVLRIIHNHVGTSQGDWMKQLAGKNRRPSVYDLLKPMAFYGYVTIYFISINLLHLTVVVVWLSVFPAHHM